MLSLYWAMLEIMIDGSINRGELGVLAGFNEGGIWLIMPQTLALIMSYFVQMALSGRGGELSLEKPRPKKVII